MMLIGLLNISFIYNIARSRLLVTQNRLKDATLVYLTLSRLYWAARLLYIWASSVFLFIAADLESIGEAVRWIDANLSRLLRHLPVTGPTYWTNCLSVTRMLPLWREIVATFIWFYCRQNTTARRYLVTRDCKTLLTDTWQQDAT